MAVNFTTAANIDLTTEQRLIEVPLVVDGMACPSPVFVWTNIMILVDTFSNGGAYIALLFPRKTSTLTHAYRQLPAARCWWR